MTKRFTRGMALIAVVVVMGALALASSAMAATSVVTQQDCNSGNITRHGQKLTQSQCEALIGQRVNLASTGFPAWALLLGGVGLVGVAGVLVIRRRPQMGPEVA
jgi:LPXTG-motif cell wall-anchored protein